MIIIYRLKYCFHSTVLCWFCPVMSVDNWQDENMPANIVNSRISIHSAVKRHGNSVFIPNDISMWHFALLHSLIFLFASSDPIPAHLFNTYSIILFINSLHVELQKPYFFSIYVYGSFLTNYAHSWEHNCKCLPIVLSTKKQPALQISVATWLTTVSAFLLNI